jgi:hypothetical protein
MDARNRLVRVLAHQINNRAPSSTMDGLPETADTVDPAERVTVLADEPRSHI